MGEGTPNGKKKIEKKRALIDAAGFAALLTAMVSLWSQCAQGREQELTAQGSHNMNLYTMMMIEHRLTRLETTLKMASTSYRLPDMMKASSPISSESVGIGTPFSHPECMSDADCPTEHLCIGDHCVVPEDAPPPDEHPDEPHHADEPPLPIPPDTHAQKAAKFEDLKTVLAKPPSFREIKQQAQQGHAWDPLHLMAQEAAPEMAPASE